MKSSFGYVFDTTCLNYLARADSLSLLSEHLSSCFIPKEVRLEIEKGIEKFPLIKPRLERITNAGWLKELVIDEPEDLVLFENLKLRWGKEERNNGEAAAIVLARRYGFIAVVDDDTGRKAAKSLGITCRGTVGILARLTALGLISINDAWGILETIMSFKSAPFRSHIRYKDNFVMLVAEFEKKLQAGDILL